MSESNPKTSEMDESTTTNNETDSGTDSDSSSQSDANSSNTSAMARALKHELEAKSMDVEIEDDGETLSAEKLGENYQVLPDGTVEGNGALKDGIERIVTDLDVDSDAENDAEEQASPSVQQDETSPDVGMDEESENESNPADSEAEEPGESSPAPDAEAEETSEADPEEEEEDENEEALPTGNVQLFEASIEVSNIQDAIDAAHAIVDECRVHLDTDGFTIKAVDPANVAMVDEFVSSDAFESYDTDCGEIGVNIERLDDVISIADSSDDLVQLALNPETRKLGIQVNGVEYTLALIDPVAIRSEPDIPDLDLPASFSIGQDHLKRAIRATDMVSDHIKLRADKQEGFIAEGTGDTDDVELKTPPEDLENGELADVDSLFSLDYLDDFRKPFKSDTVVDVLLGDDFPLKFSFEMADGDAEITYMLAPRIQSE